MIRWENPNNGRYYLLSVERDLLGDLILMKQWGSLHSRRGGLQQEVFFKRKDINKKIELIVKRREQHHYKLCNKLRNKLCGGLEQIDIPL